MIANNKAILRDLEAYNFWEQSPVEIGHIRRSYLERLKSSLSNNLIKVLVGQRRVGKSYVLKQFIDYLINKQKVDPKNIFYINFEIFEFTKINTAEDLQSYIEVYLQQVKPDLKQVIYFFFDEIQEVENWETIINSYLANHKIKKEIFITGSNSNLLSSELASYLTGRFLTLTIYPYSYSEHLLITGSKRCKESFLEYMTKSQLPETYNLRTKELITNYLNNIKDSILFRDIVKRHQVHNVDLLEKFFVFLIDNIANPYSLSSLVKKLKNEGVESNTTSLGNYAKYFEESFVLSGVSRYDLKGKQILEGERKYYVNDLGLKNYLFSSFDPGRGKLVENYVYNCLKQQNYEVYVGKLGNLEIDFVAEKNDSQKYIQACYLLDHADVVAREYGNLEKIDNHWSKLVVSLDDLPNSPKNGIEHVQAWNFESYISS